MAVRRRTYAEETVEHSIPGWGIFAITLCVLLFGGFGWVAYQHGQDWLAGAEKGFYNATGDAGLRVAEVAIMGNRELPKESLQETAGTEPGTPLLAVDVKDVQRKLSGINLVRHATVMRLWPNRIVVQITERTPIALWQKDQKLSPIDQDGVNLTMLRAEDFKDLPVVVGEGAPLRANNLIAAIADYPDLKNALHGATFVSGRRWDLFLKSGMQVKLPEGEEAEGIGRFMSLEKTHAVLSKPIAMVDLRLADRVVVKPAGKPTEQ